MVTLTIAASGTFTPTTYADIHSAISLLESAVGRSRFVLLDSTTISPPGPEAAPASRLAKPVNVKAPPTIGTYGPHGSGSFASAALQSSLASKLQTRLGMDGSTPWPMTWKAKATPSGRPYCQLAPLARRTGGTDFGLLPTPAAQSYGSNQGGAAGRTGKVRHSLESMARHNLWPTPTAVTDTGGAALCKWGGSGARAKLKTMVTPEELNGPLNPQWIVWLMGYPIEWAHCAASVTPSSRKSRRNS